LWCTPTLRAPMERVRQIRAGEYHRPDENLEDPRKK
jgi:hypothetical protein